MSAPANIIQLRRLIQEKFPQAQASQNGRLPSGFSLLDEQLGGGFPKGALTEFVFPESNSGSASLLQSVVLQLSQKRQWIGLVDGADSYDPAGIDQVLPRFLWVRCKEAQMAMRAADLLLRDGNLAIVFLDLRLNPVQQLRKIPATAWYRFQRLTEETSLPLVTFTPAPMVSSAVMRLEFTGEFELADLHRPQSALLQTLDIQHRKDSRGLRQVI